MSIESPNSPEQEPKFEELSHKESELEERFGGDKKTTSGIAFMHRTTEMVANGDI